MQEKTNAMIEDFQYASSGLPLPEIWGDIPEIDSGSGFQNKHAASNPADAHSPNQKPECQSEEQEPPQPKHSFEAGRAQGIEEGRKAERGDQSTRLQEIERKRIEQTTQLSDQFARERDRFLQTVEPELVKLALSIASRILRREAQIDPLFLAGAVRVALGHLAETTTVQLRVPAADEELWSETIAHLPSLKSKPHVIADENLHLGDCVIETDMGSADLGVHSQLGEIARVFSRIESIATEPDPSLANLQKGSGRQ